MATPSFPSCSESYEKVNFFEFKNHDKDKCLDIYRLNVSKLSPKNCYMFFPIPLCEEMLIATALEFNTFHPSHEAASKKFNMCVVNIESAKLFLCTFPIEFKNVCERTASLFKMTMPEISRLMTFGGPSTKGVGLQFPRQVNLLSFQGERCYDQEAISLECDRIRDAGNSLEKLGLD